MAEFNAQGAVGNVFVNDEGSFPLTFIIILESIIGYIRWSEDINDWLMLNNLQSFIDIIKFKTYVVIRQRFNYVNR